MANFFERQERKQNKKDMQKAMDASLAKQERLKKQQRLDSVGKLRLSHTTNAKGSNKPVDIDVKPLFDKTEKLGAIRWILIGISVVTVILLLVGFVAEVTPLAFIGLVASAISIGTLVLLSKKHHKKQMSQRFGEMGDQIKTLEMKGYGVASDKHHEFIEHYFGIDMPMVMNISVNS